MNAADDDTLAAASPYAFQIQPTRDRVWRNFVRWMHESGQLRGQKIGLYSPADSSSSNAQRSLDRSLRKPLTDLGYKLEVDLKYDGPNSAPLAAQQFQRAGVTVALVIGALTEPSGFQTAAERLGYRPKYPVAETLSETNDAVADVTYQADAQHGNLAMKAQYWNWASRKPAVPRDNAKTAYCLKAYQDFAKRELDMFDDNSVISSTMHICTALEVLREALLKAGPKITLESFVQGMYEIRDLQTSDVPAVSFAPGKHDGGDVFSVHQFKKERWQPSNNYWGLIEAYRRFPVR